MVVVGNTAGSLRSERSPPNSAQAIKALGSTSNTEKGSAGTVPKSGCQSVNATITTVPICRVSAAEANPVCKRVGAARKNGAAEANINALVIKIPNNIGWWAKQTIPVIKITSEPI